MKKTLGIALTVAALLVGSYAVASSQAPAQYVVQKGDTLWDLAGRFLGKPWHWPRIWHANPQVKNPHLIYPGDILNLATRAVSPGARVQPPIPAIPLSHIEPFLKDLRTLDTLDGLPRVVGIEEGHLRGVSGQRIYANGSFPTASIRYDILRPVVRYARDASGATYAEDLSDANGGVHGTAALDMDKGYSSGRVHRTRNTQVLGYELRRMNVATLVRPGQGNLAATLVLEGDHGQGGMEVREGDILVPSSAPSYFDAVFYPHAPVNDAGVGRRVMRVVDGVSFAGPRDVVVLDAGAADGVDVGTTYSVFSPPTPSDSDPRTLLPGEFSSHVLVFRVQNQVSYALVMDGVAPSRVGDRLNHPDATP